MALSLEILRASGQWAAHPKIEDWARHVLDHIPQIIEIDLGLVSLCLSDDDNVRLLNKQWRHQDKPTNVLSFPSAQMVQFSLPSLGDVIIAFETVEKEAGLEGKSFEHHFAHLLVHGVLHLLGYDHETDDEACEMEQTERDILALINIPDPYAETELRSSGHDD